MAIKKIDLKNVTAFEKLDLDFSEGINIFIGENGVGKTHVMKLIYSACKAVDPKVSFPHKVVRVFAPDDFNIGRLVNRKGKNKTATVKIVSDTSNIGLSFSTLSRRWNAEVINEAAWERQHGNFESTFIPAKEILSNAWNLEAAVSKGNVDFDDTYVDIVSSAKIDISQGRDSYDRKQYLDILQKITAGKVTINNDKFYLKPGTQAKIEFNLVAEGIRKIALLWQLIKNGTLEKGSVLFWDEPEANINPVHIPVIVEMLLKLQRDGVQVFVSTHDYFFAKYFEVKRNDKDKILYHSLYKSDDIVQCESGKTFKSLEHNSIMDTFIKLYQDEIEKVMQ